MSRCKLTQLKKSYKNKDVFPYDEKDLALYMQHYITLSVENDHEET